MGWGNPPVPWPELERWMSDRPGDRGAPEWPHSRKRQAYEPPAVATPVARTPYAELHCHSAFSFLDGASQPEELVEEAVRLGLEALAITDHDGLYGAVRFAEAARAHGLPTVFGAELSLGLRKPQNGIPDPEGSHLLVLARDVEGYRRLARTISTAHLASGNAEKGRPVYDAGGLAEAAGGHWLVLTGCRKGAVPAALLRDWNIDGFEAARRELDTLTAAFGKDNVAVELTRHGDPADDDRCDALAALARGAGLPLVATNNVHYATPAKRRLAAALAAIRSRRSLDELDPWLPATGTAHLRSGDEMAALFARFPDATHTAVALAKECAFDLDLVAPNLPDFPVPDGHTPASWLRALTEEGAARYYGRREAGENPKAWKQIDHELALIEQLNFPGYFLIVHDIVRFCHQKDIYCQGRGSAANSAVCYALGITKADAVGYGLLFERFLSPAREGPPDIDLDIESDRREEVIQYVYNAYGRQHAAQVANVITYRGRSAIRDAAKALGYSQGQQDAWSKEVDRWHALEVNADTTIPAAVIELAGEIEGLPRHLGIHSGGMVLADRPVVEICPVEHARMPGRTVLQWDKDDCAATGLVKFDLLGLGMLSALHYTIDLVAEHHGVRVDLATLPPDDRCVYEMLCTADSVGLFQVESRAQMATLPRLKPRTFYDIVVEVAIIRPGPIQGGSVHPYIRRRNGREPATYLHPLLEPALRRTYGVPLFQEQLMQIAVDVAGFTPAEADELRQAMGSKRSRERMARLRDRLHAGMAARGIAGDVAGQIYDKLIAFSSYGFPESHAISFAFLVYASAWLKCHYPAAFYAGLLNAQPMGFYTPQSLVADARRHGITVHPPDVATSAATATLEGPRDAPHLRIGLSSVRGVGAALAERIAAERDARPFDSLTDLVRRTAPGVPALEGLATAGALGCFGLSRRQALWAAGTAAVQAGADRLDLADGAAPPALAGMSEVERVVADIWATGISADCYPTAFARSRLDELGVLTAAALRHVPDGTRVHVAGAVTHRQRPSTAGGTVFVNLEDETGLVNVICSPGLWARYGRVGRTSPALLVQGRLECADGVINVVAERLSPLTLAAPARSRDFR